MAPLWRRNDMKHIKDLGAELSQLSAVYRIERGDIGVALTDRQVSASKPRHRQVLSATDIGKYALRHREGWWRIVSVD